MYETYYVLNLLKERRIGFFINRIFRADFISVQIAQYLK